MAALSMSRRCVAVLLTDDQVLGAGEFVPKPSKRMRADPDGAVDVDTVAAALATAAPVAAGGAFGLPPPAAVGSRAISELFRLESLSFLNNFALDDSTYAALDSAPLARFHFH